MSKCRGCGAEINWIRMRGGRLMPVNPEPVYIVDNAGPVIVVTDDGCIANGIPCQSGRVPPGKRAGHVSHFSTCPQAGQFRRRRK